MMKDLSRRVDWRYSPWHCQRRLTVVKGEGRRATDVARARGVFFCDQLVAQAFVANSLPTSKVVHVS